jgi:hypothetical protein
MTYLDLLRGGGACLLAGTAAVPLAAQSLTNTGTALTVEAGATLYVAGALTNQAGGTLTAAGTVQVDGSLTNAGDLGLGAGTLNLRGDLTNTGTLTPGTGTLRLSGTAGQILQPGGAALYRLLVDNTGGAGQNVVSLPADLTITNSLTLGSGLLRTSPGAVLTLGNGATLQGEAPGRYVQGNLRVVRAAVGGSAAVDFGHGFVLNPQGNSLGQVTVTRTAGLQLAGSSYATNPQNSSQKGIDRIWTVAAGTAPATPVQLTLQWLPDDDNGLGSFSSAVAWRETSPGSGHWQPASTPTDASSRSLSFALGSLARLTVSSLANPLPVELLDFTAERRGPDAELRWATAQEKDNAYFELESSLDGRTFRALGRVAGQGSSTRRHDYRWRDANLARYAAPLVYYRLRQVDHAGTDSYSAVRTVRVPADALGLAAAAFPNPYHEQLTLRIQAPQTAEATLRLQDATGRRLLERRLALRQGSNELRLEAAGQLPPGLYLLTVEQGAARCQVKLTRE